MTATQEPEACPSFASRSRHKRGAQVKLGDCPLGCPLRRRLCQTKEIKVFAVSTWLLLLASFLTVPQTISGFSLTIPDLFGSVLFTSRTISSHAAALQTIFASLPNHLAPIIFCLSHREASPTISRTKLLRLGTSSGVSEIELALQNTVVAAIAGLGVDSAKKISQVLGPSDKTAADEF